MEMKKVDTVGYTGVSLKCAHQRQIVRTIISLSLP